MTDVATCYPGDRPLWDDQTLAAKVVRVVAEEMRIDDTRIREFVDALEYEAITTVEELRLLEMTHWKALKIPIGLVMRVKDKIKPPPSKLALTVPAAADDSDEDTAPSTPMSPTSASLSLIAAMPTTFVRTDSIGSMPPLQRIPSIDVNDPGPLSPSGSDELVSREVRSGSFNRARPGTARKAPGILGGTRDSGRAQSFSLSDSQTMALRPEDAQSLLAEVQVVRHNSSRTPSSAGVAIPGHALKTGLSHSASSLSPDALSKLPASQTMPVKKLSDSDSSTSSPSGSSWVDVLRDPPGSPNATTPSTPPQSPLSARRGITKEPSGSPLMKSTSKLRAGTSAEDALKEDAQVQSGTLEQLLDIVIPFDGIPDWSFIMDFLIVYRYFTSPQNFFVQLMQKYQRSGKFQASATGTGKKGDAVALRVINILRKWVSLHYYDFEENRDLLRSLIQFTSEDLATDHPVSASRLILAIQEKEPESLLEKLKVKPSPELICEAIKKPTSRLLSDRTSFLKKYKSCFVGSEAVSWVTKTCLMRQSDVVEIFNKMLEEEMIQCVTSSEEKPEFHPNDSSYYSILWKSETAGEDIEPPKSKKLPSKIGSILDVPPVELARQLTLIEFELFASIRPTEIRNQAWTQPDAAKISPHVTQLTDMWNKHSCWVATEIIAVTDLDKRREVLKWFINFADALREMRNYNALMSIVAGLNFASLNRLKHTWKGLTTKQQEKFQELSSLCIPLNNYKVYREELKQKGVEQCCLPALVCYLKDLTFTEDGNKDYVDKEKSVINFTKMRMIAAVFTEIQKYQQRRYRFVVLPQVVDMVKNRRLILDQNELYEKSFLAEASTRQGSSLNVSRGGD